MSTQWQKARATLKTQREAKKHYCCCGCGQEVSIAKWSDAKRGYVRGKPTRFVRGHSHHRPVAPLELHAVPEPAPFSDARRLYHEEKAKRDAKLAGLIALAAAQFQEAMDAMKAAHNPHGRRA